MKQSFLIFIILLIILAIAAFFRLWQLNSIPLGLYPDVAMNGNDAIETIRTGNFKVFYPENNGREGFFIWLIALSFLIFGISVWSIKIVAAIFGILTVFGLYLLTKQLFSKYAENSSRHIALLSAFFLAISFWHTNFSRIGFRAIMVPFILVFSFYFLFRGFNSKGAKLPNSKRSLAPFWNFIIAGILFGLGFYTYISFRLAVLIFLPVLIFFWFYYKKPNLQKKYLFSILYFLFFIFITVLPLAIYFLKNPQDFIGRSGPISVFAAKSPIKELGKSLILHLTMFNFLGDHNWRHNFSDSPQLLWPVGIFFLIGLILSIKNLFLPKKNSLIFHLSGFFLTWFFVMLLPGVLTYEGIPHALRTIGVIPVAYIFSGLGAYWLFGKIKMFFKTKYQVIAFYLCLFILFLSIAYAQFDKYFFQWAKRPEVEAEFSKNYFEIGNYLNSLPSPVAPEPVPKKYVIVNQAGVLVQGIPMPAQTPMFIERTKYPEPQAIYLLPENIDQIKIEEKGVIVFMGKDEGLFNNIRQKFPGGELQEKEGFWLYEVK